LKVFCITLGFVPPRIWAKSCEQFYKTKDPDIEVHHYFVNQWYPLNDYADMMEIHAINHKYGVHWIDPQKNMGLHNGFNWALEQVKPADDDIIIGYDPDSFPCGPGWLKTFLIALSYPDVVWASSTSELLTADKKAKGYDVRQKEDRTFWLPKHAVANSVCAWKYNWLKEVGFLDEPRDYYGLLECNMWNKLKVTQKKWAFCMDHQEVDPLRTSHDRSYVMYKWCHAHLNSWPGDFKSYLQAGCPVPNEPKGHVPEKLP